MITPELHTFYHGKINLVLILIVSILCEVDVDKEAMVRKAVELAKKQGALFTEDSPSFRPKNDIHKRHFYIGICTNTRPDSSGNYPVDKHFSFLDGHNEKTLANYFIDIYNKYNIDLKATNIK